MTIKVNLLPTERKRFTFDPLVAVLVVLVCAALFACAMYSTSLESQKQEKEAYQQQVKQEIEKVNQSIPEIQKTKTEISKLKGEIEVIKGLKYDPVRYGNLLTEVGKVLPDNTYIGSLSVEPSTCSVNFTGSAIHKPGMAPLATIAELMKRIDTSDMFTDSSLSSTSQQKFGSGAVGFSFQIEAHYNPDVAAGLAKGSESSKKNDAGDSEEG